MKNYKGVKKMNANNKFKTMNAASLYTREYGPAAYQAWRRREVEITALARNGRYSVREICRMREDSFRQMKAEGASRAAAQSAPAAHVAVKAARADRVRVAA